MKCPVCNNHDHIEIDLHSDGYAKDIIECSTCGALWSDDQGLVSIINNPSEQPAHSVTH